MHIALNRDWTFTRLFDDAFARGAGSFETVDLPHTCIETPFDYFDESIYQMVCGYRRVLKVPSDWAGKRVFLTIGAAGHSAEVYVDGKKLSEHRCGYTAFTTELTEALTPGQDALLVVRVDSREQQDLPPFGYVIDYMTYGGLYREVWLDVYDGAFVEDVCVRPTIPDGAGLLKKRDNARTIAAVRFEGRVETIVTLRGDLDREHCVLRQTVTRCGEDRPMVTAQAPLSSLTFTPGEDDRVHCSRALKVPDAALWDVESPALYRLETALVRGGEVLHSTETTFGFRRAEWRENDFVLNGRRVQLRGLNRHQSWPYVGYAMPARLQRMDAEILKNELGLNAVRTSHYPQSHHFIDRCDELGLLVFTEIPGWQHIGGEAWKRQAVRNTEDMVRQYRNHPSIVLWGVRINESRDDDPFYTETNAAARALDPTRATAGVRCHKNSSLLEDVYTYNDFSHSGKNAGCEPKRKVTSDMKKTYVISEYNGHMFPTKTFDPEEHRLDHALRHANVLDAAYREKGVAVSFGWCMFDYNTHQDFGSGDRICYHGVMDMFRNPKLAAAVYAAQGDAEPVLEISSSMDIGEHPAGNRGRIFIFTNADEVKMYKNGVFIRSYTHKDSPYKHLPHPPIEVDDLIGDAIVKGENFKPLQAKFVKDMLNYNARFGMNRMTPEQLFKAAVCMTRYGMTFEDAYQLFGKYIGDWGNAAIEYRFDAVKDGVVVKSVRKSPMKARVLRAEAGTSRLQEGETYDATLVRIAMTDQNGNVLPFYNGALRMTAEGPIRLIGAEHNMLRGGLGGVFVRTTGESGSAKLIIEAEGTAPVEIPFTVG